MSKSYSNAKPITLLLTLIMLALGGCMFQTVYVESEVPEGTVPEAPPIPLAMEQTQSSTTYQPVTMDPTRIDPESKQGRSMLEAHRLDDDALLQGDGSNNGYGRRRGDKNILPEITPTIMARFMDAYQNKGRPRIAILLNRELSDEVREWGSSRDIVKAEQKNAFTNRDKDDDEDDDDDDDDGKKKKKSKKSKKESYTTKLTIDRDPARDLKQHDTPSPHWGWGFESGLMEPFLTAGARLVDRNTIVRLTAAKTEHKGNLFSVKGPSEPKIEMDALQGHADVFIEVLVVRSGLPMGYEFKAMAKEVKTGNIIAHVTSVGWKIRNQASLIPHLSEKGDYGYGKYARFKIPAPRYLAFWMVRDLMIALTRSWGGRSGGSPSGGGGGPGAEEHRI